MSGVTNYPTSEDNFAKASPTNLGDNDTTGRTHSERHDDVETAMEAVQHALGVNPGGVFASVAERLDSALGSAVSLNLAATSGSVVPLTVTAWPTQGTALTAWYDAGGTVLASVGSAGAITAPAFFGDGSGLSGVGFAGGTVAGDILGPNGSATAPGFAFSSDPNTGIYRSAADTLGIAAGGSAVMTVDTAGFSGYSHAPSLAGTVVSSSGTANAGYHFDSSNCTTTSTANFRLTWYSNGTTYSMGVWNKSSDVIPVAAREQLAAVPYGSTWTMKSSDGTTTIRAAKSSIATYSQTDDTETQTISGSESGTPNTSAHDFEESLDAGVYMDVTWTTYTIVTDIANLDTYLAQSGADLVIGGTAFRKECYSVSGGTITLDAENGLTFSAGAAVSVLNAVNPVIEGADSSGNPFVLGVTDAGGIQINNPNARVTFGDDFSTYLGAAHDSTKAMGLYVTNRNYEQPAAIGVETNSASYPSTIYLRRSLNRPAEDPIDIGSYDASNTVGQILFDPYIGGYDTSNAGKIRYVYNPTGQNYLSFEVNGSVIMQMFQNGTTYGLNGGFGPWDTFSPTLAGTGWAIGNGTATGYYAQIGQVVWFFVIYTFGSTSTFGSVSPTTTLPYDRRSTNSVTNTRVQFFDQSAGAFYDGTVRNPSSTTHSAWYLGTSGLYTAVTSTAPFTWASSDSLRFVGHYERA